ncbi:MAG: suppressor of fused domain protein [Saccharofermentans sp.]|nr:suppressor of fused domain protein [Saccharofermentans sp.]
MTIEEFREKAKNEDWVPGWDAIESVFKKLYPEQEPHHFASKIEKRAMFGGPEYIDGYSLYKSPNGYTHIVTFGMTELYAEEESLGGEYSRWGYEMTMKLPEDDPEQCVWAVNLLGNLGRYTYTKESWFEPGHFMSNLGESIKTDVDSCLTAIMVVPDTEAEGIDTIYGRVDFLQFVGITTEEYEMLKADPSKAPLLAEAMRKDTPHLVTDINRTRSYKV